MNELFDENSPKTYNRGKSEAILIIAVYNKLDPLSCDQKVV